jgi:1-acyl-sn-glycerol-3-phosphate acyltransferase
VKYWVTAYFWWVFALTAPLEFVFGCLLFLVTAPFDPDRRVLHAFVCRWTFQYLRIWPGWKIEVHGRERLPQGPAVLVANHQSMADVGVVMALFHPFKFVSKASLFRLPLVGQMMRLSHYISLERGKRSSHQRMMEQCRFWLKRGMSVLLFPEGTYRQGEQMLPFKRGAFVLASEERVPVVPIVLTGTEQWVRGDGPWMSPTARVRVVVLPAMFSHPGETADDFSERVREAMNDHMVQGDPSCP